MDIRVICAAVLLCALPVLAQDREGRGGFCPPQAAPVKVKFTVLHPAPVVTNDLPVAGIHDLFLSRGNAAGPRHRETLGMTSTKTVVTVEGRYAARPGRSGYCVYLTEVAADFGLEYLDVYVGREFPPGSCAHDLVLAHEMRHVAVMDAVVEEFTLRMRGELDGAVAQTVAVIGADPQETGRRLTRDIRNRMSAVLDIVDATAAARHADVDSAQTYADVLKQCPNWRSYLPEKQRG